MLRDVRDRPRYNDGDRVNVRTEESVRRAPAASTTGAPHTAAHRAHYRRDIDGVRALAVLLVVGFHAFPSLVRGGFVGVDVFFVISGYLITGTILRDIGDGCFTFLQFYARRFRRIAPALVVVLTGTLVLGAYALLSAEFKNLGEHTWAGAAFVNNLLLWRQAGYFDAAAETKPLLHLWSLGIEEQFYLLWPPLLVLSARRGMNTPLATGAIAGASFATNVLLMAHHATAAFYLLPGRFWELLVGGILAQVELELARGGAAPRALRSLLGENAASATQNAKAWIGLALVLAPVVVLRASSRFPGWWALAPTIAAFLLISAGRRAWLNRVVLSSAPAVAIGLISYPLYLWHWPLLSVARIVEQDIPGRTIRVGCVLVSLVLAWLTWLAVERPVQKRLFAFGRSRRLMRACVAASVTALLCIAAAGAVVQAQDGFPGWFAHRFPERSVRLRDLTAVPSPAAIFPQCTGAFVLPVFRDAAGRPLNWCNTDQSGKPPEVALLGDSHALYMFPGFAKSFADAGVATMMIGQSSCAPILGVRAFLKGTREQCSSANQLMVERLATSTSLRTVILSSLGPYYFSGTSFASDHAGFADASNWVLEPVGAASTQSKQ